MKGDLGRILILDMNTGLVRGRFCWQPTVYCSFQYVAWKVVTWDNPTVAAVGQLRNITNVISRWWISRPVEEDHYCPVLICQLNYLSCVHQLFITQDPLLEPWPRQSLDWSSLWKIARLFGQLKVVVYNRGSRISALVDRRIWLDSIWATIGI